MMTKRGGSQREKQEGFHWSCLQRLDPVGWGECVSTEVSIYHHGWLASVLQISVCIPYSVHSSVMYNF